jgi:hypothetical protein
MYCFHLAATTRSLGDESLRDVERSCAFHILAGEESALLSYLIEVCERFAAFTAFTAFAVDRWQLSPLTLPCRHGLDVLAASECVHRDF